MAVLQQVLLYEIIQGTLPMCQNITMRVNWAWIKRYCVFFVQKHITPCSVVITSLLVREKPLGSPASVKRVYCKTSTTIFHTIICRRWKTNICHIEMQNFDKYRHKGNKAITHGIMKSIKQRGRLCRELNCISRSHARYHLLKNKLNTFNKTLKKTIREVKLVYHRRKFEYIR